MIQKVTVKSWKSYEQHTPKGNEKMKKQEQQKNGCRERSLTSISRRVSSGAMLVALAMIFSYVESRKRHVDPVQSGKGYFKFSGDAAIEADQRIFHDRHKHCRRRVP